MSLIKTNQATRLPSVLDDMFNNDWLGGTTNFNRIGTMIPAVNIYEDDENFTVEVAAPGKTREDFHIELDNEILTISSKEKREEKKTKQNGRVTRKEFNYNNFSRAFTLPETVNSEKISASYENGILIIDLPIKEEAKVQPKRMIKIS